MIHDLLCLASSLSIMFSGFVPVLAGVSASSLSLAEYYSSVCIDHVLFVRLSVDGHLCLHFFAHVNSAIINICVQVFVGMLVFDT